MEITKNLSRRWKRLTSELPDYALHYFDALKAHFETLPDPQKAAAPVDPASADAYAEAQRIVQKPGNEIGWTDLMLLDLSIVRVLSLNCLVLKVAELRHRVAGHAVPLPQELSPKLESMIDDAVNAKKVTMLRCEAESLVTQLWQLRIARNSRDRYVGELRRTALYGMITIVTGLVIVGYAAERPPLYLIILAAGMMGALTSILRRLQSAAAAVTLDLDQNNDLSALAYERRAILISLVAGGVFAILLYVVFVAGLSQLAGDLAPHFIPLERIPQGGVNFGTFVNDIGPKAGDDYAKVVIWSFAAGFFEQLVPDMLDRMVKRGNKPQ